jgi:NAD-dependent dihydropyrimidine dehydrogenase PreA subunit
LLLKTILFGNYFLIVFTGALYLFKRKELDTDAIYTMLSLVAIIIISLLLIIFQGIKIFFFIDSVERWYGFAIGAAFSGVVGVGFYPIMEIVFGVVLAAPWPHIGITTTLSKFRITNGGQCISCGNCSTYCEMGIDVRSYAEKEKTLFVPPV